MYIVDWASNKGRDLQQLKKDWLSTPMNHQ